MRSEGGSGGKVGILPTSVAEKRSSVVCWRMNDAALEGAVDILAGLCPARPKAFWIGGLLRMQGRMAEGACLRGVIRAAAHA